MNFEQICIAGVDGHAGLNLWENRLPYLYLDSRKINGAPAPLVTVGVGCAISLAEALTLPFQIDGRAATQAEIAFGFATLKSAPSGYVAGYYAKYTRIRLPDSAIDALVESRFRLFIAALQHEHPGFDTMPELAKAGCLDLIYGLGITGYSAPHYPSFRAAINRRDFAAAAAQCGADENLSAYDARNKARKQLFLAAAKG